MNSKNKQIRRSYLHLLLGCLMIYGFIFHLVPRILQSKSAQPMMQYIEEQDLDNSALFYTESPVTGQVEFYIKKHGIQNTSITTQ